MTHQASPYVRHKHKNALQSKCRGPENKMDATKDAMRENNDHLLAGTWKVTLKSPDLYVFVSELFYVHVDQIL